MAPSLLHYFKRKKTPSPPPSSRPLRPPPQQQQPQRIALSQVIQATPAPPQAPPQGSPVHIPSLVRPTFTPSPSPSPSQDDEQESGPKQDKGKGKEKEEQGPPPQSTKYSPRKYDPPPAIETRLKKDLQACEKLMEKLLKAGVAVEETPMHVAMGTILEALYRDSLTDSIGFSTIDGCHYLLKPEHRNALTHHLIQYYDGGQQKFFVQAFERIYLQAFPQKVDFSLLRRCGQDTGRTLYLGNGNVSNEVGANKFVEQLAKDAKRHIDEGTDSREAQAFKDCPEAEAVYQLLEAEEWILAAQTADLELYYAGVNNSKTGGWIVTRKALYDRDKVDPERAQFCQKRAFGDPGQPHAEDETVYSSTYDYYEFGGPLTDDDFDSIPVLLEAVNTFVVGALDPDCTTARQLRVERDLPKPDQSYSHMGVSRLHPLIPSWIWLPCRDHLREFANSVNMMREERGFPLEILRYRPENLRVRINMPCAPDSTGINRTPLEIPVSFFTKTFGIKSMVEPLELPDLRAHLVLDDNGVGISFSWNGTKYTGTQIFKSPESRDDLSLWYWRLRLAEAVGTLGWDENEALREKADSEIARIVQTQSDREELPTYETDKKIDDELFGLGFPATIHISTGVTKGTKLTIRPLESLKHRLRFYDNGIIQVKLTAKPQKALKKLLDDTKVTINGRRQSIAEAITRKSGSTAKQECWITLGSPSSLSITIPDFNFVIPDAILPDTEPLQRFRKRAELVVRKEAGGVAEGRRFYRSSDRSWKDAQEESAYDTWFRTNRKGPKYAQWATPSSTSSAATSSAPAATSSAPVTSSSSATGPSTSSATAIAVTSTSRIKKSANNISSFFAKQPSSSTTLPPPTTSSSTSQPVASAASVASSSAPAQTSSLSVAAPPAIATPSSSNPTVPLPLPSTLTSKLERFRLKGKEIDPSVRGKFGGI